MYAYANVPLLTTRAAFVIKANPDLARRWRESTASERRKIVADAERRPLPTVRQLFAAPPAPEVEWFYSVRELCELAQRAADTPLAGINPGLARREAWKRVVYKGGSESGVLNLTTLLEDDAGTRYCVAATGTPRRWTKTRSQASTGRCSSCWPMRVSKCKALAVSE